jgi:hypothetical protein
MIERSRTSVGIQFADGRNGFIDAVPGNKTGGEISEKTKARRKVFQFFLLGKIEERAST